MIDRPEILSLLRHAHDEIVLLRRRASELEPKAHAYDTLAIIVRLSERPENQGYGIDVAWRLKSAVEELEAERVRDSDRSGEAVETTEIGSTEGESAGPKGIAQPSPGAPS